jgi:hypothetical protein
MDQKLWAKFPGSAITWMLFPQSKAKGLLADMKEADSVDA